jgi:hypothetical protein
MITPKEKAEELYDKFYAWYPNQDAQFIAKQCALICCDEVLGDMGADRGYEFWSQVKDELHKL